MRSPSTSSFGSATTTSHQGTHSPSATSQHNTTRAFGRYHHLCSRHQAMRLNIDFSDYDVHREPGLRGRSGKAKASLSHAVLVRSRQRGLPIEQWSRRFSPDEGTPTKQYWAQRSKTQLEARNAVAEFGPALSRSTVHTGAGHSAVLSATSAARAELASCSTIRSSPRTSPRSAAPLTHAPLFSASATSLASASAGPASPLAAGSVGTAAGGGARSPRSPGKLAAAVAAAAAVARLERAWSDDEIVGSSVPVSAVAASAVTAEEVTVLAAVTGSAPSPTAYTFDIGSLISKKLKQHIRKKEEAVLAQEWELVDPIDAPGPLSPLAPAASVVAAASPASKQVAPAVSLPAGAVVAVAAPEQAEGMAIVSATAASTAASQVSEDSDELEAAWELL